MEMTQQNITNRRKMVAVMAKYKPAGDDDMACTTKPDDDGHADGHMARYDDINGAGNDDDGAWLTNDGSLQRQQPLP